MSIECIENFPLGYVIFLILSFINRQNSRKKTILVELSLFLDE